jgi:hypothetical protein
VTRLNNELRHMIAMSETRQMFEKTALLSLDADSPTLTKRVVDELDHWKAFFEEKSSKK